ncbi:hypothetical protein PBY51_011246 [Eleginops maclovinus]|nr:hypothetical protein PBY51_011246 [Eleginops maclovinus]
MKQRRKQSCVRSGRSQISNAAWRLEKCFLRATPPLQDHMKPLSPLTGPVRPGTPPNAKKKKDLQRNSSSDVLR